MTAKYLLLLLDNKLAEFVSTCLTIVQSSDKQYFFGTDFFENVWERMIDKAFGVEDKEQYFPRTCWLLDYGRDKEKRPLAYNIAWYEQKAVIVLLALLYLGVKNIHLGPTLPGFLSPNVAKVLVETFGIAGIGSVDDDIKLFMGA